MHWGKTIDHRRAAVAAACAVGVFAVLSSSLASDAVRLGTSVAALVLMALRGRRWEDRRSRTAIALVWLGLFCAVVSGLIQSFNLVLTGKPVDPAAPVNWLYLLYAPLAVAGFLTFPRRQEWLGSGLRSLSDGLAVAGALAFSTLIISKIPDALASRLEGSALLTTNAYAVLPCAVVATALSVHRHVVPERRTFVTRLTAVMAVIGSIDIAFCIQSWRNEYTANSVIAAIDEIGIMLLVWATFAVRREPIAEPDGTSASANDWVEPPGWQQAWQYVVSGVAVAIAIYHSMIGERVGGAELLAILTMVLAAVVRHVGIGRQLRMLNATLTAREAEAQRRLHTDDVTGLPNRLAAWEHLVGNTTPLAVALLDIGGFSMLNDNHGHAAGDELLRLVSGRLTTLLPAGTFVARTGADEFMVIAPCDDDGERLLEALRPLVSTPATLASGRWRLAASIGVALATADGGGAQDVLSEAELALQTAKERWMLGGEHVVTSANRESARRRARVRDALGHPAFEQFHLVFQPILDLPQGGLRSVEALLRWTHPALGSISPGDFIPLAEQAGSIMRVSDHVLGLAATAIAGWHGAQPLHVAVNLSSADLTDPDLLYRIYAAFDTHAAPLELLTLEVTEEGLLEDFESAAMHLAVLQAKGVKVAIDDFGTGYASLRYLRWFRPDVIKVDQEFVRTLVHDRTSRLLVAKVNEIAVGMGGVCVAEGIEDGEVLDVVRSLDVQLGQGFHLARPMPYADLVEFVRSAPESPARRTA